MPNLNVTPQSVLLAAGQSVTFVATDSQDKPVAVLWTLNPSTGGVLSTPSSTCPAVPPVSTPAPPAPAAPLAPLAAPAAPLPPAPVPPADQTAAPAAVPPAPPLLLAGPSAQSLAPPPPGSAYSAVYVAPPTLATAQTVAVIATSGTDSVSATVSLTPNAVSIFPAKADLHVGQRQQFVAFVASAMPDDKVVWNLSPPVGTLDQDGLYIAPEDAPEAATLTVIAASRRLGQQGAATITLEAKPWHGIGTDLLAGYLFLVFCAVFFIIGLWPQEVAPNLETLRANQLQAEKTLQQRETDRQTAITALKPSEPPKPPTTATEKAKDEASAAQLRQFSKGVDSAQDDLDKIKKQETDATAPDVNTRLFPKPKTINRDVDLILLVLLAGCLGSFLHSAQSFSDFAGNRTLKSSWVWWYCFQPFIGSGLALVLYAALRGGLITAATVPAAKATDLNPYALVAAAALAGMFSKSATTKLGDVFETLFLSGKSTKDKLDPNVPGALPPTKPTANNGTGTGTAPGAAPSTTATK